MAVILHNRFPKIYLRWNGFKMSRAVKTYLHGGFWNTGDISVLFFFFLVGRSVSCFKLIVEETSHGSCFVKSTSDETVMNASEDRIDNWELSSCHLLCLIYLIRL